MKRRLIQRKAATRTEARGSAGRRCRAPHLGGIKPCTGTCWEVTSCTGALLERTWGLWWAPGCIWTSSELSLEIKLMLAGLRKENYGQLINGSYYIPSTWHQWGHTCKIMLCFMSCPVYSPCLTVQMRCWWGSSTKLSRWPGHTWAEGQRADFVVSSKEAAKEASRNSPQLLEGPLQRWLSQILLRSGRQDSSGHKLKCGRSQLDMRRSFLTRRWCTTDTGCLGVLEPPPLGALEPSWDTATADVARWCWWKLCFEGATDPLAQPRIQWSAELLPGASTETSDNHFNHNNRFSSFCIVSSNITQKVANFLPL